MAEICPSSRVAIELDALRRYMDANAERIEHVVACMCRGKDAVAPREAFESRPAGPQAGDLRAPARSAAAATPRIAGLPCRQPRYMPRITRGGCRIYLEVPGIARAARHRANALSNELTHTWRKSRSASKMRVPMDQFILCTSC